jgi:hypothetical protein
MISLLVSYLVLMLIQLNVCGQSLIFMQYCHLYKVTKDWVFYEFQVHCVFGSQSLLGFRLL